MARPKCIKLTLLVVLALMPLGSAQVASAKIVPSTKSTLAASLARIQHPGGISIPIGFTDLQGGPLGTYDTPAGLSQYGWGAAATWAKTRKPHSSLEQGSLGQGSVLTRAELSQYGWGAAGTYAKAMKHRVGSP